MKQLFTLNKYLIRYKWHFILGILFVTGSNYFKVKIPQTIRKALDYVIGLLKDTADVDQEILSKSLIEFSLIILGFAALMGVFMYFMRQTIIVMSRLIEYDLRKDVYDHYQKLDVSFYKTHKTGDIMSRISEDVSKVRMYLGPAILYGINLTSLSALVIYSMFNVSVKLTLYTLLPLPFLSISIYFVSRIIHRKSGIIQKQLSKITSVAQEVYSGIAVVKSYVQEDSFLKHFDQQSEDYKDRALDLARVNAFFFPLMILLVSSSTLLTVYIGSIEVANGNISQGTIAEFIIYVNFLTWPFTAVGWVASIIQQAEASQERINAFLDREPLIRNYNNDPFEILGEIEFRNVSFTYPETGVKAINNLSFKLKRGEKLALIGKTAAGKSTIVDLILRTYDIDQGQILLDGTDLKDINLEDLRRQIGYVPQDVFLFSTTIADNIRFGNPEATDEMIKKYSAHAAVKEDIEKLPQQYETMVGERGVTLSGGQKQRISLARAFIKGPKMVILDDSLSAVDTKTERKILDYIKHAIENKTAIIITHRIFSLLDFDQIIFLEDGKILEQGSHEELLNLKGNYYELYEKQQLETV